MNNSLIAFPDNLMGAKEMNFLIERIDAKKIILSSSEEISNVFTNVDIEVIKLYKETKETKENKENKETKETKETKEIKVDKRSTILPIKRFLLLFIRFFQFILRLKKIKSLMKGVHGVALISSDRSYASGYELPFLYYCKKNNIKTIIPKVANFAKDEGMLKLRSARGIDFEATLLEKVFFPLYCKKYNNKIYVYYSFDILLIMKVFGLLSKNPWIMGASNSSLLMLDSFYEKNHYLKNGVEDKKILVTGSYKITDNIKNSESKIRKVGFALPQLYEHGLLSWIEHIQSIEKILKGLFDSGIDVILFLHPKMNVKDYLFLEGKYNCSICRERTELGLNYIQILISTYSTVVNFAIVKNIPSLIIDSFNAKYEMFDIYNSVRVFYTENELLVYVNELYKEPENYEKILKLCELDASKVDSYIGKGLCNVIEAIKGEL